MVAKANKLLQASYPYTYYSNYGKFPTTKHHKTNPYSQKLYGNQQGYSHYLISMEKRKRKALIPEGLSGPTPNDMYSIQRFQQEEKIDKKMTANFS